MRARSLMPLLVALALVSSGGWALEACTESSDPVGIVRVATSPADGPEGPEAATRAGDYVLNNGEVLFVVQSPESSSGWGLYGGSLMDGVGINNLGLQPDHLEEIFVQCDLRGFRPTSAEIVTPGDAETPGVLRLVGADAGIPFLDAILPREPLDVRMTVDFTLPAKGRTLQIDISAKDLRKREARELACGVVLLPGDAHRLYVPVKGFTDEVGGKHPFLAAEAPEGGSSYVLHREAEPLNVLLSGLPFLPIATEPKPFLANATLKERYLLTVGQGPGVEHALSAAELPRGPQPGLREVELALDGTAPLLLHDVSVLIEDPSKPEGQRAMAASKMDLTGFLRVELPPGRFDVRLDTPESLFDAQGFEIEVVPGEGAQRIEHSVTGLGYVHVQSKEIGLGDLDLGPTPARVGVIAGHGAPHTGARLYEAYAQADHRFTLPEGPYTVVVSRGPEHELHVQDIDVAESAPVEVQAELRRVVDRSGWVSADLHVHATRSSDSETPRRMRVLGAAAEGLDLLVATDHDAVTDYQPQVVKLQLQDKLRTASGTEMSMLYGHINGFPVQATAPADHWRPAWFVYGQDGRFERALEPVEVVQALRAEGAEVVQINHPRASQSLFNYIKLDPATGASEKDWPSPDAMELLNGKRLGEYEQVIQDFHGIILAGRRITGTGTSDIHGDFGVGYARTYVRIPNAGALAELDLDEVWSGLKAGRVVAASGPFVQLSVQRGEETGFVGDTLTASGPVTLAVQVQAPSWMRPNHIKIYHRRDVLTERDILPADADPLRPALRFDGTFTATVTQDTYFMVEVSGTGGQPWVDDELTVSNPIYVDADGDGLSF